MLEKRLLLLLSVVVIKDNDIKSSINILLHLLELSDQNIVMSILEVKMLLKILLNLSYNYHRLSNNELALIYSERGISLALEYDLIYLIGHFLFRKGIAQYHSKIPEYMQTLSQCIIILKVSNNDNLATFYKNSLNENYKINI